LLETNKLMQQGPIHVLRNLLPQGQRFAGSVAQLVAKLRAQLGIDAKDLDSTEASLASIDTAIRKIEGSRALTAELFPR
jgi:ABC-type transporter Mla subunit MlaD